MTTIHEWNYCPNGLIVIPVDEVDDHLDDSLFFLGPALGNEERQGHQGIVGQSLAAVSPVEDAVSTEEVDEQSCRDPFVAVAEGVVLYDEIEEVGPLFLDARVEFLPAEGLVDGPQRALETLILFDAEKAVEL
jgi:hypothetical protein